MAGQTISVDTAGQMLTKYTDYMTGLGVNMEEQTQSVSFSIGPLMHWLNSVSADSDEIRIFMGAYPDGEPQAGRTTVVLWPYKDGSPAESTTEELPPFNDGAGNP